MEKSEKNIYLSENHHFAPIGNKCCTYVVHNAYGSQFPSFSQIDLRKIMFKRLRECV